MSAQRGKDLLIRAGDGAGGFAAVAVNRTEVGPSKTASEEPNASESLPAPSICLIFRQLWKSDQGHN